MRESQQVARLRASPRDRSGVTRKIPQLAIELVAEKPALLGGRKGIVEVSLAYKAVERPVIVSTEVRLSEIDLKTLDLSRAVYLSQYGRYYAILKVQTSKTDICKVELLQLP